MPAPPPPPPAPTFNLGGSSGDTGRGALLQSIRAGKALKKTVTVDKSAPAIGGRVRGEGAASAPPAGGPTTANAKAAPAPSTNGSPMGLGGLFSGGMPKLKPTGMRSNLTERDNNGSANSPPAPPSVKRGPPPVPPPAAQKPQIFPPSAAPIAAQEPSTNHSQETTPRSSFGKPTLAPKPPNTSSSAVQQKPSPPPKKLSLAPSSNSVSRAQSMRMPRSPAVLTPTPASLHQSQDYLNEPLQRPIANRAPLRAPGVRPPSPPTSRVHPTSNGAATLPHPQISRVAPMPPCRAPSNPPPPPPLPHRSSSSSSSGTSSAAVTPSLSASRLAPAVPPPPTPPTRGQSLQRQNGPSSTMSSTSAAAAAAANNQSLMAEFEARFADKFHSIATFPLPEPFRGVNKVYNSKIVAATKQQAPEPPTRSVSTAGGAPGPRQPMQQPQHQQKQQQQQQQQQQWQQQNAASSAC